MRCCGCVKRGEVSKNCALRCCGNRHHLMMSRSMRSLLEEIQTKSIGLSLSRASHFPLFSLAGACKLAGPLSIEKRARHCLHCVARLAFCLSRQQVSYFPKMDRM
jgi:hypothetical protein